MNKNLDDRIYHEANSQLSNELNRLPQRKVLHSRILKLSGQNQYKVIGITLFESGQVQASLIPLKRATVIRPQDAEAQIHLAQAFIKLEKENQAFLCLQKALCSSPNNFQLHAAVIKTLYGQGKLENLGCIYQETASMLTDKKFLPGLYSPCAGTLVSFNPFLWQRVSALFCITVIGKISSFLRKKELSFLVKIEMKIYFTVSSRNH